MIDHSETRIVPYTAGLMYAVVADVERYPEFLPWVLALRIKSRTPDQGREILTAEMMVGYGGLRERYTSRVVLDPSLLWVDVAQITGPFRKLENHWGFTAMDEHRCEINFSIAFEFHNRILAAVAARSFEKALLRMTDAFETRAAALSRFPA